MSETNDFIMEEHKAWLFFKAWITGKTKYLECKDHEKVFIQLYDAYFEAKNDAGSMTKLNAQVRISELKLKIAFFKHAYTVINDLPLNQGLVLQVQNSLKNAGLKVDLSNPKEALSKIKQNIDFTENDIEIQKLNLNEKSDDKKAQHKFNFSAVLVGFETILGYPIKEDMSLAKFLSYEKTCEKKIKEAEKQKQKRR